jgi:hypothetical protein
LTLIYLQVGGSAKRNAVTFSWAWADVIGSVKVHLRISAALDALQTAVTPEVRCWAADLSKGKGGSEPKLCVVTTPADFIAAYLRVPFKHAYEVIDDVRGCHPFLDLPIYSSAEYEAACRVLCTAASDELRSVAGRNGVATNEPLVVDILLLDVKRPFGCAGTGKCSRRVVCRSRSRRAHVSHVSHVSGGVRRAAQPR